MELFNGEQEKNLFNINSNAFIDFLQASVYYIGRFKQNNKEFDSTKEGPGFKFRVGKGEVIKGWDLGVVGMKVGGKRLITCPPHMAYVQQDYFYLFIYSSYFYYKSVSVPYYKEMFTQQQKFMLFCFSYGQKGSPPAIPPNSTLVFEVELKSVN